MVTIEFIEAQSERRRVLLEMSDARVCRLSERIRELEAELADCDKAWRETGNRAEKAEAEAGRLRAALEEIAKGDYKCDDWICDAPAMAQTALDELAGLGHERGREK